MTSFPILLALLASGGIGLALVNVFALSFPQARVVRQLFGMSWAESLEAKHGKRTRYLIIGQIGLLLSMGTSAAHSLYLSLTGQDRMADSALNVNIIVGSIGIIWCLGWLIATAILFRKGPHAGA